jgi:thymidylate kinase
MPISRRLLAECMPEAEERSEFLWRHLHDSSKLYVCDRHVVTSSYVYDRLYNRAPKVEAQLWCGKLHVLYFRLPLAELLRRHQVHGDDLFDVGKYEAVLTLYAELARLFPCTVLDASVQPDDLALAAAAAVEALR